MAKQRGTDDRQEMNDEHLVRDTRSTINRIFDSLRQKTTLVVVMCLAAALVVYMPILSTVCIVIASLLAWLGLVQIDECPIKIPIQANNGGKFFPDPHEIDVGTGKPKPAGGIFYLGYERKNGKEVWLTNDDCRQHFLILGTTGSGKTELLVGFCANALTWSSGFLIVDGKGDVAVFAKIFALARRFGREDDLLVLNFMTGDKSGPAGDGTLMSNTMNPFSTGSSDSLTQMIVSLMDDVGGDGAMWKGRATAMLTGVMRAMSYLRDEGILDLNVGAIRDHMALRKIIDLGDEKQFPDLNPAVRHSIKSYLSSLPGFQPEKGYKQAQTTLDQHGYLEMQFTKILGSLADVYGHIFATPYGEVDMFDVVLNRRILIVMLPALEKSSDEVANLGKIVVASLKRMMGFTLGNKLEGSYTEIVSKRLTNSPSPFVAICDEVGYYCVDGMDLMAAQARSLGFSMTYAAQDINGMKRLNEKIVGSIIGNTNTKIIMRIEDPETAKMAVELAGKAYRATVGGFSGHSGEASIQYRDNLEARIDEVERIKFLDMKAQENGQMHVVYKDTVVRAQGFYANPEGALNKFALQLRANHFIKIEKPKREELEQASKIPEIMELLLDADFQKDRVKEERTILARIDSQASPTDDVSLVGKGYRAYRKIRNTSGPVAASCAAIANIAVIRRGQIDTLARRLAPIEDDSLDLMTPADVSVAAARREPAFAGDFDDRMSTSSRRPDNTGDPSRRGSFMDDFDDQPKPRFDDPRRAFDDMADPRVRPFDDEDDDDMDDFAERRPPPQPTQAEFEDLARRPRMQTRTRQDVEHTLEVSGRPMDDEVEQSNDAVFRLLAELDFDPDKTTSSEVETRIEQVLVGNPTSKSDMWRNLPAPREAVDAVAYEAERALPPSVDDAEPNVVEAAVEADKKEFITDFLAGLLDEDESGK